MKYILSTCVLFLLSANFANARTNCPAAKIKNIQIESQKVLYLQEGAPWRTLGRLNSDDGTRERYSALLAWQAVGKSVMVAYSDEDYDCSATDYSTSAYIVRTYN